MRRLAFELKNMRADTIGDIKYINWDSVRPFDNPTLDRMLISYFGKLIKLFESDDIGGIDKITYSID